MTGPSGPPPGPHGQQAPTPSGPYPPAAAAPTGWYEPAGPPRRHRPGLLGNLGPRLAERPAPRLGVTLAGVGVALGIVGVVVWTSGYVADAQRDVLGLGASGGGESRHYLGAVLALVAAAIGYALAAATRGGPLTTAGVGASVLGVPIGIAFLGTPSVTDPFGMVDVVVWVSLAVYAASYLLAPGARGHVFYVGAGLLLIWQYATITSLPPVTEIEASLAGTVTGSSGGELDLGSLAGASLTLAAIYYLAAAALDRRGRRGIAVAFVVVGVPAVLVGVAALAPTIKQVGVGLVLLVLGLVLSLYGARSGRRFTNWFWAVAAAAGAVIALARIKQTTTGVGVIMVVLGVAFVAAGWYASRLLREPRDVDAAGAAR